jgi:uncharacterized protein (UPF0333 family)
MLKKKTTYLIVALILLVVVGIFYFISMYRHNQASGSNYTTTNEYYDSVNYSCKKDADCAVKDVHNCCGEYMQCTNKNAKTDADFVNQACAKEGIGSICVTAKPNGCKCVKNKCEGI